MGWMDIIKEWVVTKSPDFLANILGFIIIIIIGKIAISLMCKGLEHILERSKNVTTILQKFFINVLNKTLWLVVLMIAIKQLGVDIGPLIAALGVGGFVIGFALQNVLGNLASGVMIMLNRPFDVGDAVDAAGHKGIITEINLMSTIMNSFDNKKITIPNTSIWGESILNYTANDTRRVDMLFGIGYNDNIDKAKEIISRVLRAIDNILDNPEPTIELVELADSSVNIAVRPWVKTEDYWSVYFKVHSRIKDEFDKAGIEIPYPQMDIHTEFPANRD